MSMGHRARGIGVIIMIMAVLVLGGCDDYHWAWEDDWGEHEAATVEIEEPAMTFINETGLDLTVVYSLGSGVTVKAVVLDGLEFEFESGVTRFTLR